jgi:chemotaxis protein methyltransferase CheR
MNNVEPATILQMDKESFVRLSTYITEVYGIKLPPVKKAMLESRLGKKVKQLGMSSYKEFLDYIFSDQGKKTELLNVVDLVTTNKTDFLREPLHFQFLTDVLLPGYVHKAGLKNIKVWSAACSTGEEPYSLVMVLEEFKKRNIGFDYSLAASDISIRAIQTAHRGIYTLDRIDTLPIEWKRMYFLTSKDRTRKLIRVKPVFRSKISYKRINLVEEVYGIAHESMDIIFCRNVLIYFDKATQERVIQRLTACLRPGGILFLGHSESTMGMEVSLKQIKPTIYQRPYASA